MEGPMNNGGLGPLGGDGGTGPVGGGGTGPVGGGGPSRKIFKRIACELEELSCLFDDLAETPFGCGGGLAGGAVDFDPQIVFIEERQEGCELCWIAVAVSVAHYFEKKSSLLQCELVGNLQNPVIKCCDDLGFVGAACDKVGSLGRALDHVRHLAAETPTDKNPQKGHLTFAQVKVQIDNNVPICIYIQWPDTTQPGHFSVISGYHESGGKEYLYVNDPIYGSGPQPYNRVVSNYNMEGGSWQYTYRLKA
jgi:hypothetical protein